MSEYVVLLCLYGPYLVLLQCNNNILVVDSIAPSAERVPVHVPNF